jgi:homoserine kinase type II
MAVFTHITAEQLAQHLTHFNIGKLVSFTGITEGVSNTNYKIITDRGPYILTLFEERTRKEDVPFFISFMKHLHSKGIPCPDVIATVDGKEIINLNGKPAIITSFLDGAWPQKIEDYHVAAVGTCLARMHLAAESFKEQRVNSMSMPAWRTLISACKGKTPVTPFLLQELDFIEKKWPLHLTKGAVHADLFPDNVFFTGEKLTGVIDFYFSCTDVFVYDLMLTFNAWCFEATGYNPQKAKLLLEAYQKERPLSGAEQRWMNFFGRAAALRIIATRLYDALHPVPGAVITPKDPGHYLSILRFHQSTAQGMAKGVT